MSNFHGQQLADYCALDSDPIRRFSRYVRILGWLIAEERRVSGSVEYLCRNTGWQEIEQIADERPALEQLLTSDATHT
jgi:hypothetical protein